MKTRMCNVCKTEKSVDLMVPCKQGKGGYKPLCRVCKNVQNAEYKERVKERAAMPKVQHKLNPTQMKSCGLGGWTGPRVREENEAPGVLIDYMSSVYIPESSYYRNDGLSHIKTRGTLC